MSTKPLNENYHNVMLFKLTGTLTPFAMKGLIDQSSYAKASEDTLRSTDFMRLTGVSHPKLEERRVVGLERLELSTSRLSSARSNQLSYRPGC